MTDGFPSHWARPIRLPPGAELSGISGRPNSRVIIQPIRPKYEPLSAGITLVTSLSQKTERQSQCLDTWLNIGCRIVVLNTAVEIEQLKPIYPQVHDWIECDDVDISHGYPAQKLYNLAKLASEYGNAAIINSDIEILCSQKQLQKFVQVEATEFVVGIRWNYQSSPGSAREFEWGLDLVTINAAQMAAIPKSLPYVLGQPVWDYAIPELLIRSGFKPVVPHERVLFHKDHSQRWNSETHRKGMEWLSSHIGMPFDPHRFRKLRLDPDFVYNDGQGKYLYNHWPPLHRYGPMNSRNWDSATAEKWYNQIWLPKVPNIGCSCQPHWAELTKRHPPDFSSAKAFFEWGWSRHDDVSRMHSKRPLITLSQAYEMYYEDL